MEGEAVSSDHTLSFRDFTVQATFEATREGGELAGPATSINGAEIEAGQWLFVVDADDPEAALVAVDAPAPELPGHRGARRRDPRGGAPAELVERTR